MQHDDSAHGDTRRAARITTSGAWPFGERRRLGRSVYANQHLIALLRGQAVKKNGSARPGEPGAVVDPGSTWPPIFLIVLAVVLWAVLGLLVRLVTRLM
jgi:hypothetical protein